MKQRKKEHSIKISRTAGKSKGKTTSKSQNLDDLQNLLIKLTVKASPEKAWLLYEFSFSLNPGGKSNDAQA